MFFSQLKLFTILIDSKEVGEQRARCCLPFDHDMPGQLPLGTPSS